MFPKGKPILLTIYSRKDAASASAADKIAAMSPVASGRVLLQGMDADSKQGRDTLKKYSIDIVPAYVLTDAGGRVIEKHEGKMDLKSVRATLDGLAARPEGK